MTRKIFVLDTNVVLHDPGAMKKFKENDVIIPIGVLDELDGLKRNPDEKGKNAREVLRYIDSLKAYGKGSFNEGMVLPEGPTLKIFFDTLEDRKLSGFPLSLDRYSHKILAIAYFLKASSGKKVVFVSKDFVSRVKAEAIGLEAEDYENLKFSYEGFRRGIRQIEVAKELIDRFYKDGKLPIQELSLEEVDPNEYVSLFSKERSTILGRYNHKIKCLETLLKREKGVWGVLPLNIEQRCVIDLLFREDVSLVTLMGPAGTGKTLLALACGLAHVFDEGTYSRLLVSRPIVPLGKDIGYLPGTKEEKLYHWMQPIYDNLEFLCESSKKGSAKGEMDGATALEKIMESKKIEMEAVTYIRGRSLPRMYMIIDEAQNLTPHEVKTVISRAGKGTKVILTGDSTQIDNPYLDKDSNGLTYTASRFRKQPCFGNVFLDKTERSELASVAAELMQ